MKEHDRLAKLEPVARVQGRLVDGLAVDEGPVRRAQIDDPIRLVRRAGARHGGGKPRYRGAGSAFELSRAQGHGTGLELEPLTLVGPLDDEQGGHEVISPRRNGAIPEDAKLADLKLTDAPPERQPARNLVIPACQ